MPQCQAPHKHPCSSIVLADNFFWVGCSFTCGANMHSDCCVREPLEHGSWSMQGTCTSLSGPLRNTCLVPSHTTCCSHNSLRVLPACITMRCHSLTFYALPEVTDHIPTPLDQTKAVITAPQGNVPAPFVPNPSPVSCRPNLNSKLCKSRLRFFSSSKARLLTREKHDITHTLGKGLVIGRQVCNTRAHTHTYTETHGKANELAGCTMQPVQWHARICRVLRQAGHTKGMHRRIMRTQTVPSWIWVLA